MTHAKSLIIAGTPSASLPSNERVPARACNLPMKRTKVLVRRALAAKSGQSTSSSVRLLATAAAFHVCFSLSLISPHILSARLSTSTSKDELVSTGRVGDALTLAGGGVNGRRKHGCFELAVCHRRDFASASLPVVRWPSPVSRALPRWRRIRHLCVPWVLALAGVAVDFVVAGAAEFALVVRRSGLLAASR